MKCFALYFASALLVIAFCSDALAQGFSPYQRTVLEEEFAQNKTNSIDGSYIIDDSITSGKIQDGTIVDADISVSAGIQASKIANTALTTITTFDGDLTGTYDALTLKSNYWFFATNAILASTSPASPKTISVSSTNMYICVTNDWAGIGTNWLRVALSPF